MTRTLSIPALALLLGLAACTAAPVGTTQSTELSPREQDQILLNSYAAVLSAALTAIQTGQLPATAKAQIQATSQAATTAVQAYSAAAELCFRDQTTGVVGTSPTAPAGKTCNTSAVANLLAAAEAATGQASGVLSAFGVKVTTTTSGSAQ